MNAPDFTDFWHHCPTPAAAAAGLFYSGGGGAVPTPSYLNSAASGGSSASRLFNGGGFAAAPYHLDAAATAAAAVAAFEQRNSNNSHPQLGAHSVSNSGGAIAFAPPLPASPHHHQSSSSNNSNAQQQSQHCFAGLSHAAQFPANSFFGTGFGNFSSLAEGGGGMLVPPTSQNSNAAAATAAALLPFTSTTQTSDPGAVTKKLDSDPSGFGVHSTSELRLPYNPFLKADNFFPNTNTSLSSLPSTLSSASSVGITPSGYQHLFDIGGGHHASTSKGGDEKKCDDKLSASNDAKFSLMIPNSSVSFKVNNNNRSHHRHNINDMTNAETRTATIPVENTTSSSSSSANGQSDYGDSKGGHNHSSNPSSSSSNSASSSNSQSTQQQPQITCQVCYLAASNGLHFGARTCAACAAFFRRSISDQKRYICKRSQRCVIRPGEAQGYRKMCRNCRMKRCLEIGMLPENVQNKRHRRDFYFGDTLASVPEQMPASSSSTNSSTQQQQSHSHQKSGYDQQNGHQKTSDDNRVKEEGDEAMMSNSGGGSGTFGTSAANTPTALLSHSLKVAAIGDELVSANGSDQLNGMTNGGTSGGLSTDFSNLFQIHHNNISSSTIQPRFIPTSSTVVTNGGGNANLLDLDFQVAHLNHGFLGQNALSNGSLDRSVSTSSASVGDNSDQLNPSGHRRPFHRSLLTDDGENNRSVISVLSSLPTGSHTSTSLSNTGINTSEADSSNNRIGPNQSSLSTTPLKNVTHDVFGASASSASLSASPSVDHHYHGLKSNSNNNNNSLSNNNNINSLPKASVDSEMVITSPFAVVNSSSSSSSTVITSLQQQQQQKLLQQHQEKDRSSKMVFNGDDLTSSNAAEVFFSTATGSTANSDFGGGLFVGGSIFGGHYATGGGVMSDNFFTMPRWPPQQQQPRTTQLPQQQQQAAQQHPILIDQSPFFMASQFAKNV